jgi:ribosomal protein S18 acetylase RimI-like enzyme
MTYDAAVARRMLNNDNLRCAQGWCEFRDLGGALAATSDAPIPDLSALLDFDAGDREIESVLDVGFALLRAFDCPPAARVTPLDGPPSLADRLASRGLRPSPGRSWMAFAGDPAAIRVNADVDVRIAAPDDAARFASVHAGSEKWLKRLSLQTTLTGMIEDGNTFYIGYADGQSAGACHLLRDGATTGIYAVGTAKPFRRRGICSTLIARAIADARAAACDVICLSTTSNGDAERLFHRLGFARAFESVLWTAPSP